MLLQKCFQLSSARFREIHQSKERSHHFYFLISFYLLEHKHIYDCITNIADEQIIILQTIEKNAVIVCCSPAPQLNWNAERRILIRRERGVGGASFLEPAVNEGISISPSAPNSDENVSWEPNYVSERNVQGQNILGIE